MNCCFLVICISFFIGLVLFPSPAAAQLPCPGTPGCTEEIDTIPQDIVEFATRKLKSANYGRLQFCAIEPVGTFTQQVVAGMLYTFDLKIQRNPGSSLTCPISETCPFAVRAQPQPQPWMHPPALELLDGSL